VSNVLRQVSGLEPSGNNYPVTQHHSPEDRRPQVPCYANCSQKINYQRTLSTAWDINTVSIINYRTLTQD